MKVSEILICLVIKVSIEKGYKRKKSINRYFVMSSFEYWVYDGNNISFFGEFFDVKKVFKLLESNCNGCFFYEFNYSCMW